MRKFQYTLILVVTIFAAAGTHSASDEIWEAANDYSEGRYGEALTVLLPEATPGLSTPTGDPIAQFFLGEMFYYGEGLEQNYSEAMNWYMLSAEQGDPDAAYAIGAMYEAGDGAAQSIESAVEWYKRGIDLGSEAAFASLGLLYVFDEGEYRDIDAGLEMLMQGAHNENMDAQFYIGSFYYAGEVVEQDLDVALRYLRMAEGQGDSEALELITWILGDEQYAKDYDGYIAAMRLSPRDEHALKCENYLWSEASGLALGAHEAGDEALLEFSESALARVNNFGEALETRLYASGYDSRQGFREIDGWLTSIYEDSNSQLMSKNRADLSYGEKLIYDRKSAGIFDIVFHDAYTEYSESIDDDRFFEIWGDCVTEHLPDGIFVKDIGVDALLDAFDEDSQEPSALQETDSWTKSTLRRLSELNACEGDFDFAGGAAIGTLATSVVAGDSAVVLLSSSGMLVATAPAVATGIATTALVGSAVYLSAKGYCYFTR